MHEGGATPILNNVGNAVRPVNDLWDALRAVAIASKMDVEALERIEDDLLAVCALAH